MKIAVIGCGAWGQNIIRNFAELGVLAGVCDLDFEKSKSHAEKYHVPALCVNDILNDSSIDGVAIITHSHTHFDIAKQCLKAGKHVFVEKPLTLHSGEAFELAALAKKLKRVLMVGHLLRYHPAFIQLLKSVAEGKLGKVRRIISNRLNVGRIRPQETVLWDLVPHDLSMIMAIAGDHPDYIYAHGNKLPNSSIMDAASCQINFAQGIETTINVSWVNPVKEHKLVVIGTKGMMVFDDTQAWGQKLQLFNHQLDNHMSTPEFILGTSQSVMVNVAEPLKAECQHFLDCIREGLTPLTHAADAAQNVAIIEACHLSIDQGRPLKYQAGRKLSLSPTRVLRSQKVAKHPKELVLH
jgi:UDP-2-acetamido-3-amino-2,3-dideoxy-glucuronate N-acetyltransferase